MRASSLGWHHLPYRDFAWEYPPLAALPLVLVPATGRVFGAFQVAFLLLTVTLEYGSLILLRRARPADAGRITAFWTCTVVPISAIAWFRLDWLPTALATVALVALVTGGRRRRVIVAVVAGFGAKLWPVVLALPLLLQRRWRDLSLVVLGSAAILAAWYAFSPSGFEEFLRLRRADGFQVESIPGNLLLLAGRQPHYAFGALYVSDAGWQWVQSVMTASLLGIPLLVVARRLVSAASDQRRTRTVHTPSPVVSTPADVALIGGLIGVALLGTKLLSPQFLVWLAPFVVWLWPQHRTIGWLYGVSVWLSLAVIQNYGSYLRGHNFFVLLGTLRNLLLVALTIGLLRIGLLDTSRDDEPSDTPLVVAGAQEIQRVADQNRAET